VVDSKRKNVTEQLNTEHSRQLEENRQALESIVKTIILCGAQELSLRGTDDSGDVIGQKGKGNDGNFRSLLRFRCDSGDTLLDNHLRSSSKVAMYTSPTIQNEIIDICGSIIKEVITDKDNRAGVISLLADETTDIARIEQMSVCLRYIDPDKSGVLRDFLQFVPVYDVTGKGLATTMLKCLEETGICLENMVGQGYDGVRSMSGHLKGASAIITNTCPRALYVHCCSHSLNLALSDSCQLKNINNCIGAITAVGTFLRSSAQWNNELKKTILKFKPHSNHETFIAMCTTRFVQRHDSVLRFEVLYVPIVQTLEVLENSTNREASQKAHQMLALITDFSFVISLKVCSYVMAFTLSLSKVWQSVNLELVSACAHVDDVLETLRDARTNAENEFQSLFSSASELIANVGGEVKLPRGANREGRGVLSGNDAVTPESFYRVNLFIPFIDNVTVDLTERFTKHRTVILALEKLLPSKVVNVQLDEVLPYVEFYRKILPLIGNFAADKGTIQGRNL